MITLREVSAEIVLVGEACMDFAGSAGVCSNTAVRIRAENAGTPEVTPTIPKIDEFTVIQNEVNALQVTATWKTNCDLAVIDWGDGTIAEIVTGSSALEHQYYRNGIYGVRLTAYKGSGQVSKLVETVFETNVIDASQCFARWTNLAVLPTMRIDGAMRKTMTRKKNTGIEHLSKEMLKLYGEIVENFELRPEQNKVLIAACETWDRLQQASAEVREHGITYISDKGAIRKNPAVDIEKEARRDVARLFRELNLEGINPEGRRPRIEGDYA